MSERSRFFDIALSTEYHQEVGAFTQLSLYNATLPIGFLGLALCWAWLIQTVVRPMLSLDATTVSRELFVFVLLFGMIAVCAALYFFRDGMRLRYLYRAALVCVLCQIALVPCSFLVVSAGGGSLIS